MVGLLAALPRYRELNARIAVFAHLRYDKSFVLQDFASFLLVLQSSYHVFPDLALAKLKLLSEQVSNRIHSQIRKYQSH